MQRENGCPACGFRLDVLSHWRACPRCFRDLPTARVNDPVLMVQHHAGTESPMPPPVTIRPTQRLVLTRSREAKDHNVRTGLLAAGLTFFLLLCIAFVAFVYMDLDEDGWATSKELQRHTNAFNGDTDRDGLPDGWEAEHRLDPRKSDTDGDTLSDNQEIDAGTDPRLADTDDDGTDDNHEALPGRPDCSVIDVGDPTKRACDLRGAPRAAGPLASQVYFVGATLISAMFAGLAFQAARRRKVASWTDNA